ncbi:MAG: 5'-3' exonuclease, partial [Planctomycetota bacterium]
MGALVLIDGHYYAYRYFFGMPRLSGPDGQPTGVLFAYARLLKDLIADPAISHAAVVFDDSSPTFRHELYPEYKAHRQPMPEELAQQMPDLLRLVDAHGIARLQIPGYEADDIICTLAKATAATGQEVRICSRDKDIDQILNDCICTWEPTENRLRGPAELVAEKGIRPEQVIDFLCMLGDSSDNVPGIPGVGVKTATKLLQDYGDLTTLLTNADSIKGKRGENIRAFRKVAELTRQLITIAEVPNVPAISTLSCPDSLPEDAFRPLY